MDLILGFQKHFLLAAFAGANGFVDQTGCFQFGRADLLFGGLLANGNTNQRADTQTDNRANDGSNHFSNHKLAAHLLLNNKASKGWAHCPYMKFSMTTGRRPLPEKIITKNRNGTKRFPRLEWPVINETLWQLPKAYTIPKLF